MISFAISFIPLPEQYAIMHEAGFLHGRSQLCNGVIQILWFVNLLIRQVSKCRLVPAECSSIYGGSNSFVPLKKPFELVVVESMEVL